MKSGKALIYAPFQETPFQEPIHQYSGNLPYDILTLERVWVTSLINNESEIKVVFHNHDEVYDDHHIITSNPKCENLKVPLGLITVYCAKDIFKDFTQLVSKIVFVCH